MNLSGREKATIFLSIVGSDTAARVLRYLPEELADVIATSINHLPTPTPDALGSVLSEFRSYLSLKPAESFAALEGRGEMVVSNSEESLTVPKTPIGILNAASAKKLAYSFSFERPQIVAFIVSRLKEEKQEEVLMNLGPQKEMVSELIKALKPNKFTSIIEQELIESFSQKV